MQQEVMQECMLGLGRGAWQPLLRCRSRGSSRRNVRCRGRSRDQSLGQRSLKCVGAVVSPSVVTSSAEVPTAAVADGNDGEESELEDADFPMASVVSDLLDYAVEDFAESHARDAAEEAAIVLPVHEPPISEESEDDMVEMQCEDIVDAEEVWSGPSEAEPEEHTLEDQMDSLVNAFSLYCLMDATARVVTDAASQVLPAARTLSPCRRRKFSRNTCPKEASVPVQPAPFPVDCLPPSTPIAQSRPPAAEVQDFFRGQASPTIQSIERAPLEGSSVVTALSTEARELSCIWAADALASLAQAAQEEASCTIQRHWRQQVAARAASKAKIAIRTAASSQARIQDPAPKPLPVPPGERAALRTTHPRFRRMLNAPASDCGRTEEAPAMPPASPSANNVAVDECRPPSVLPAAAPRRPRGESPRRAPSRQGGRSSRHLVPAKDAEMNCSIVPVPPTAPKEVQRPPTPRAPSSRSSNRPSSVRPLASMAPSMSTTTCPSPRLRVTSEPREPEASASGVRVPAPSAMELDLGIAAPSSNEERSATRSESLGASARGIAPKTSGVAEISAGKFSGFLPRIAATPAASGSIAWSTKVAPGILTPRSGALRCIHGTTSASQ